MKKENQAVPTEKLEAVIDLSLDAITDVTFDHSKAIEGMDFAERMEYFWRLTESKS